MDKATGIVVQAFGNLLHVRFDGAIRQGELARVQVAGGQLLAEVIEIAGTEAKIQVFEDTRGIKLNTPVHFEGHLLEAELGPGLLTSIFDGLPNVTGVYLTRGVYMPPLDRKKKWEFTPLAKVGDVLRRGDSLGFVPEGRFKHLIMVPFSHFGKVKITSVAKSGSYTIDSVMAEGEDEKGRAVQFKMSQRWPVKIGLSEGKKVKPTRMMDTGMRILDTQFPVLKGGTFCSPGPFGAGNPEPMLALPAHTLAYVDPVGANHLRARFRSGDGKFVNAIAFRAAGTPLGKALIDNRNRAMHAAGQISVDRWQGEQRVQMRLTDVAVS